MPFQPYFFNDTPTVLEQIQKAVLDNETQNNQIDQLFKDVAQIRTDFDTKLPETVFNQLNDWKADGSLQTILKHKKLLIIGDSYLAGIGLKTYTSFLDPPNNSYGKLLIAKGIDATIIASPGAGFYWVGDGGKFSACLDRYSGDKDDITDIIVMGGSNDYSFAPTESVLQSEIVLFCNKAKEDYKNAKIHIGWLSQMNYEIDYKKWNSYKDIYYNTAIYGGYSCIGNSEFLLKPRNFISSSDLLHPTSEGHAAIANFLYTYILQGSANVNYTINNLQLTKTDGVRTNNYTLNFAINMTQSNNIITIDSQQSFGFVFNSEFPITLNGRIDQAIYLGSMDGGLIWGRNTTDKSGIFPAYTPTAVNIPVEISHSGGVVSVTGRLVMIANNWFITLEHKKTAAAYDTITPTQIDVAPFTANINANAC